MTRTLHTLWLVCLISSSNVFADTTDRYFSRIATFPAYLNTDIDKKTVAEIVAASRDGNTLVYTDGKTESLGFVDIHNPHRPKALGILAVGGEPTSVAVAGKYALVVVNTSKSYNRPAGHMHVVNIGKRKIVQTYDLGGQPDSIAVSPDGRYAAVAIENERDEDHNDGALPQLPGGFMQIIDLQGQPANWSMRKLELAGLPGMLYGEDPEPEYVDINQENIAVVTLQENNHLVLIELASGRILNHFSAGQVSLSKVDTVKDKLIQLDGELKSVLREPDGVSWISDRQFATADEGDYKGGSRGFTVFDTEGHIVYQTGNSVEHTLVRHGHFPEKRAAKKGNEPENVEYGRYGASEYLFVGSERGSVILVYLLNDKVPQLLQVLPAAMKPEGLLAIPQRNLFISAGEKDDRSKGIRSALSIYQLGKQASYPDIISTDRPDGTPIPWGALSGLSMDHKDKNKAYAVQDNFYRMSRVLIMDISRQPIRITGEIVLQDKLGKLSAVAPDLVQQDRTVDLDLEGISSREDGGFWLISEGGGAVAGKHKPVTALNLLIKVSQTGIIKQVITLPGTVNKRQKRSGFEGVASVGRGMNEQVFVAFQREWKGDPKGHARIGRYGVSEKIWQFYYYPLEPVMSPLGGWVGMSDLSYLGNGKFAVIERDNQAGSDARVKCIYMFNVTGLDPIADDGGKPSFPILNKKLILDLIKKPMLADGVILEKIEGMSVQSSGAGIIINDNDGVNDSNGETRVLRFNAMFK